MMTLGKAILFAPQDVTVTQAFADWTRAKTTGPPWPELADLPHAGTTIPAGRPVLTVFAQGASHAEVERMLQARMEEMEQRLVRPHRSRVGGAPVCKTEQATAKNPPPPTSRRWSE